MKENNRQDNTSSRAIANQQLEKKSNALTLEPPTSQNAGAALAPPVQMNPDNAATYVAKRQEAKEARREPGRMILREKLGKVKGEKAIREGLEADEKKEASDEGAAEGTEETLKDGAEKLAAGFEFGSGMQEGIEDIDQKLNPNSLTTENMEWDENTKRSEEDQEKWATKHGHSKEDVAKMKKDNAESGAATDSVGLALSFFNVPGIYRKIKSPDSYKKFEALTEAASVGANIAKTGSSIANATAGGTNDAADSSANISKYTGGIIDLVKKGYTHFKSFKEEYENYQLIQSTGGDASKVDGAKVALNASLDMAKSILEAIKTYQSTFTAFQNPAIAAAIPGLGIAISAISLFERIFTLYTSGKLEVKGKAANAQTDSIMSQLTGLSDEQKATVATKLSSPEFRSLVTKLAAAYQHERDNPGIFKQFKAAKSDAKLAKQLKKRYPSNFAKIELYVALNERKPGEAAKEILGTAISDEIMTKIVYDQSIIDHLHEIKGKRETNAKIGIFTDLVNIGADIATLTGAGAAVGVGMKLGTSAIAASRSGGNAVKFAARDSGAADFASGAQDKWRHVGSSAMDSTDILKNREAKKERYFSTSKLILDDVISHETTRAASPATKEADAKVASSKEWVETKIMGTGASLTLTKAKLNSDEPETNTIKYLMDCLKKR